MDLDACELKYLMDYKMHWAFSLTHMVVQMFEFAVEVSHSVSNKTKTTDLSH